MHKKGILPVDEIIGLAIVAFVVLLVIGLVVSRISSGSGSIFSFVKGQSNDALSQANTQDNYAYHDGVEPKIVTDISSVPVVTPKSGSCTIPASERAAFDKYESIIKDNVAGSGLKDALAGTGYIPEALFASVITLESHWNPRAVGPCGDGGIAQFQIATATGFGLSSPGYGRVPCSVQSKTLQCSACSKCNPNYASVCDYTNDQRFNPELALPAAAKYLGSQITRCKSKLSGNPQFVSVGVSAYNTGNCDSINANYISLVIGTYYPQWAACLSEKGYSPN